MSKPQVIEALSKIFPDLNANQLNSIYEGKRMVGGRMQNTFPFSKFMKKGAAAVGGEREKAASLQRIKEYDDFLAKNPPKNLLHQKLQRVKLNKLVLMEKAQDLKKLRNMQKTILIVRLLSL